MNQPAGHAPTLPQATGVELAELFGAFTADYDAFVAPLLDRDAGGWELAVQLAAAPQGGFADEETVCSGEAGFAGPLRYVHGDAPVLLLQSATDWDGGPLDASDLVKLDGVQFTDGVPLFYFYAGFYS